jgi:hypothetical protein
MKKPNAKTYQHLDQVITNARFPRDGERIRQILHQAFKNLESNLNMPYELHGGKRATRDNFGAPLPHGQRDETLLRHHLIAELFRVWEIGHDEKPIIKRRKVEDAVEALPNKVRLISDLHMESCERLH